MSGSPVYLANEWKLFGIYVGTIFPDNSDKVPVDVKRLAAIGLVVPLFLLLSVFKIMTGADGPFEESNATIEGGHTFLLE